MKNFNKYIIAALLGGTTMGFTSCSLDEYNPSNEGADAVFATEKGMENLVNQMYYNFRWKFYGREDPCLYMEGSADIWQNIGSNYDYGKQLTRCVDLQGDRGQFANVWNRVYDNINVCNTILERLDGCKGLSAEQRSDFEGEAKFMRSYCYWWLVEFFGDIELRTKGTTDPVFTAQRTDRKTIYDEVIIPDAKFAAENLPVTPYEGNVGRSTKKAAKALLARVLLTRAQYEEAGSDAQKAFYQQALDASLDVINHKADLGIKIYDTYDEIWQAKNNKTNTEYLWVATFSSNSTLNADSKPNRIHSYFSPKLVGNAGIQNTQTSFDYPAESTLLMPTYYFMNLWEDWDIRYDVDFQEAFMNPGKYPYKWKESEANKYNQPELTDKKSAVNDTLLYFTRKHIADETARNYATVDIDELYDTDNVNAYGGAPLRNYKTDAANYDSKTSQYIAASFPRFMKYRIWDGDENGTILLMSQQANQKASNADVPVMRYAEMPLIAAECYIALGNPGAAASIINQEIRTARVVKPGHSLSEAQVNASQMTIDWIMDERARELCGEWLRWFDVKRVYSPQGKFASTITGRNPSMTKDDCMQEYHALRPIPNTYLDKLENADQFGQNPGYNPYTK